MKIVLWIGNESNQRALANKINSIYPLAGIITESRKGKRKFTITKIIEKVIEKFFLPSIGKSWWGMKSYYDVYSDYPNVEILDVENINSTIAYDFVNKLNPDLIIVSGTRLLKEKMLSIKPSIGILNLHTGFSPYIKGGPNCTNWCLESKQYHLIGNTVMWIDLGIDSGNIITTEFTKLNGDETLLDIHIKVMDHAHDLYLRSIGKVLVDKVIGIDQRTIDKGRVYYTKQWGLKQKIKLILNLKDFRNKTKDGSVAKLQKEIQSIQLG